MMRGVQPKADDPLIDRTFLGFACTRLVQPERSLIGVSAVHEVPQGIRIGELVGFKDGPAERGPSGQQPVSPDCERYGNRNTHRTSRAHNALSFTRIAHRDGSHPVDAGCGERPHLAVVIALGLARGHRVFIAIVIVITRADASAHRELKIGRKMFGGLARKPSGARVHLTQRLGTVAKHCAPVGIRSPGRRIEHERHPGAGSKFDKRTIVLGECCAPQFCVEQGKCGKLWQLLAEPFVERGFDAAIGERHGECLRRSRSRAGVGHAVQSSQRSVTGWMLLPLAQFFPSQHPRACAETFT